MNLFLFFYFSLFCDLRSMSGTLIMNLLATLFMTQLMYVIGVGGTQVTKQIEHLYS